MNEPVRVGLIRGDGIGPEIAESALRVMEVAGARVDWQELVAGEAAVAQGDDPLPAETLKRARELGVLLKGPLATPVGSGWRSVNVALRRELDLFANLRPVQAIAGIRCVAPETNMVIVRENTEGLYAGLERETEEGAEAIARVSRTGSERVCRFAFEHARAHNRGHVTVFHKANILKKTSGLFLEICRQVAEEYRDIGFREMIIDAACMNLVLKPARFDVVVTTNLFGDIVSDLAAGLVGGLGLAPGANLGSEAAMFESVHGTAPDIAGRGIANPTAFLLAAALMLEHVGQRGAAFRMDAAVRATVSDPRSRTADLGGSLNTAAFTDAVIARLQD
jgi:isocitrate dehydrogenase (NAD+)